MEVKIVINLFLVKFVLQSKPTDPNLTMTPGIEITTTFEEFR